MRGEGRPSYFFKQFSFNLLVCMLVIALVMPLCISFYTAFDERQKENYRNVLQVMLDDVNANLDIMRNLARKTEINESLQHVSAIRGRSQASDTIALVKAQDYVSILIRCNPYIADCLVAFAHNDIILTGKSVYYTSEELKKFYHFAAEQQLEDWFERLDTYHTQARFLAVKDYSYIENVTTGNVGDSGKLAFCYEIPFESMRAQGAFFLLIAENALLQKIPEEFLNYSEITLKNLGETVYCYRGEQYGADAKSITISLGDANEKLCLSANLNIAALSGALVPTRNILLCYLIGALLAMVGLAVFFTKRQFKPMHTVLEQLRGCGYTLPKDREQLSFVVSAIGDMQMKHRDVTRTLANYREQLSNMQMDRLLSAPYTPGMQIPDGLPERYRVGYAYILSNEETESSELLGALVARCLRHSAPEGVLIHQMENDVFALIVPVQIGQDKLREMLANINFELPQELCLAMSAEAQGPDGLYAAFENAQMNSMGQRAANSLCASQEDDGPSHASAQMGMRIYREVMSGNTIRACECITEMMRNPSSSFRNVAECYGYIRLNLCFAIQDAHLPENFAPPASPGPVPPEKMLQLLLHSVEQLGQVEKERALHREMEMETEILDFVENHLDDWTLNAETVARQFAISERKVQNVARQSGEASFSAYLQRKRMLRAAQLLVETNLPVSDIGSRSGYNISSTFFKAFKRMYGISPSEYRTLYSKPDGSNLE